MCSTRFSWLSLVLCPSVIWAYLRQVIETLFLESPISGVLQRCYYFSFHEWATLFCFSDCFIIFYKNYFWYCNMVTLEITFSLLPREYYYCLLRAVVIHLFSDFLNYLARTVCSVTQLWLSLCHLKDCSPLGSSVHGIFQARILQWVVFCYSRVSSWPRNGTHIFCVSCTDSQILYHCATWEAHSKDFIPWHMHHCVCIQLVSDLANISLNAWIQ